MISHFQNFGKKKHFFNFEKRESKREKDILLFWFPCLRIFPINQKNIVSEMTDFRDEVESEFGLVYKVAGPLVVAKNMSGAEMYELVKVGPDRLVGEVIKLEGETASIQTYEDTSGLTIGDPVERTHRPLSVLLGPGIMNNIFDGIQRPLKAIREKVGTVFLPRGVEVNPLDVKKKWPFNMRQGLSVGDPVSGGDVIGFVFENALIAEHRVSFSFFILFLQYFVPYLNVLFLPSLDHDPTKYIRYHYTVELCW
jgi:hypothetical protein